MNSANLKDFNKRFSRQNANQGFHTERQLHQTSTQLRQSNLTQVSNTISNPIFSTQDSRRSNNSKKLQVKSTMRQSKSPQIIGLEVHNPSTYPITFSNKNNLMRMSDKTQKPNAWRMRELSAQSTQNQNQISLGSQNKESISPLRNLKMDFQQVQSARAQSSNSIFQNQKQAQNNTAKIQPKIKNKNLKDNLIIDTEDVIQDKEEKYKIQIVQYRRSSQDTQLIKTLEQQITYIMNQVNELKTQHKNEVIDLKRKIVDTEKRLVQMWELLKESNKRSDQRINDFQQLNNQLSSIMQVNDQSADQASRINLAAMLNNKKANHQDSQNNMGEGNAIAPIFKNISRDSRSQRMHCTFLLPNDSNEILNKQKNIGQQQNSKQSNDIFIMPQQNQDQYNDQINNNQNSELSSSILSQGENNYQPRSTFSHNLLTEQAINQNNNYQASIFQTSDMNFNKQSMPYLEIEEEIQAMMVNSKQASSQASSNLQSCKDLMSKQNLNQIQQEQLKMLQKQIVTFENSEQFEQSSNYKGNVLPAHNEYQNPVEDDYEELSDSNLYSISHTTYNVVKNRSKIPQISAAQNLLHDWKFQMDNMFTQIDQQRQLRDQKKQAQVQQPTTPQQAALSHRDSQLQYKQLRQSYQRVQSQNYNIQQIDPVLEHNNPIEQPLESHESSVQIKFQDPDTVSRLSLLSKSQLYLTAQLMEKRIRNMLNMKIEIYMSFCSNPYKINSVQGMEDFHTLQMLSGLQVGINIVVGSKKQNQVLFRINIYWIIKPLMTILTPNLNTQNQSRNNQRYQVQSKSSLMDIPNEYSSFKTLPPAKDNEYQQNQTNIQLLQLFDGNLTPILSSHQQSSNTLQFQLQPVPNNIDEQSQQYMQKQQNEESLCYSQGVLSQNNNHLNSAQRVNKLQQKASKIDSENDMYENYFQPQYCEQNYTEDDDEGEVIFVDGGKYSSSYRQGSLKQFSTNTYKIANQCLDQNSQYGRLSMFNSMGKQSSVETQNVQESSNVQKLPNTPQLKQEQVTGSLQIYWLKMQIKMTLRIIDIQTRARKLTKVQQ
eukprot:403358423